MPTPSRHRAYSSFMLRPLGTAIDAGARSASERFASNGRWASISMSWSDRTASAAPWTTRSHVNVQAGKAQAAKQLRGVVIGPAIEPRVAKKIGCRGGIDGDGRFVEHDRS